MATQIFSLAQRSFSLPKLRIIEKGTKFKSKSYKQAEILLFPLLMSFSIALIIFHFAIDDYSSLLLRLREGDVIEFTENFGIPVSLLFPLLWIYCYLLIWYIPMKIFTLAFFSRAIKVLGAYDHYVDMQKRVQVHGAVYCTPLLLASNLVLTCILLDITFLQRFNTAAEHAVGTFFGLSILWYVWCLLAIVRCAEFRSTINIFKNIALYIVVLLIIGLNLGVFWNYI